MTTTRVLFLIDSMQMGGAERITAALLPRFDRSRITPILCTLHTNLDSPLVEQIRDIPRFDLGAKRLLDPLAFRRLLKILRSEKIQLIHAQLQDATVYAVAANKLTGIPVITTRHLMGDMDGTRRKNLRNKLEHWTVSSGVKRVITVSDASRDMYAQMTGIPASRFQTIYNGIDLSSYNSGTRKSREALGLPQDKTLITMVGVLRPGKGQDVAIEAAKRLQSQPNAHFVFVGDGENREKLEEQARGLTNVTFLGQRMDVPDIWRASDIAILPSDSEALPTVLIEAGAAGLPVIASRVGGVPEIIEDGVTGYLTPPRNPQALADAICRLLENPQQARQMGERACERVHRLFTLDGQVESLTGLYETLI